MSHMSPVGVVSFPNLFQPRPPSPGAEPRYSMHLIWDQDMQKAAEYAALRKTIVDTAKGKWGEDAVEMLKTGALRSPLRKAAEKADKYSGYDAPGAMFANFWTKQAPGVVDAKLQDVIDAGYVFAGCLARATYAPFAYDNSGNRGVGLLLNNVQITDTSTPRMDGRAKAQNDFDALDDSVQDGGLSKELEDELPF